MLYLIEIGGRGKVGTMERHYVETDTLELAAAIALKKSQSEWKDEEDLAVIEASLISTDPVLR